MSLDGHRPLAHEFGVQHQRLPAGRGHRRPDCEIASEEAAILDFMTDLFHRAQRRADAEIHVRQRRMLGEMGPHRDGGGVPVLNFHIDIAESGIKSAFVAVHHGLARRPGLVGEPDHVLPRSALVSGGVFRQNEHGFALPVADQPDAAPHVNGLGQPVPPLRDENDPGAPALGSARACV